MIELILVRHGETDSNKRHTYCGWTDIDLNPNGLFQAQHAAEKLKGTSVDAIYSSPLKRALHTAEIINRNFGKEIILSDSLKERNFGVWEDLTYEEIRERYPAECTLWTGDWTGYRMEGGESAIEADTRVAAYIDALIEKHTSGTFILVAHLGCIRKIIAHLLDMPPEGVWRFRVGNGGISRIEINDEKYAYLTALNAQ